MNFVTVIYRQTQRRYGQLEGVADVSLDAAAELVGTAAAAGTAGVSVDLAAASGGGIAGAAGAASLALSADGQATGLASASGAATATLGATARLTGVAAAAGAAAFAFSLAAARLRAAMFVLAWRAGLVRLSHLRPAGTVRLSPFRSPIVSRIRLTAKLERSG